MHEHNRTRTDAQTKHISEREVFEYVYKVGSHLGEGWELEGGWKLLRFFMLAGNLDVVDHKLVQKLKVKGWSK